MKAKPDQIRPFGLKTIQATIAGIEEGYLPALEECLAIPLPGNVSFAIAKNHRMAMNIMREYFRKRYDLWKLYAVMENGVVKMQNMPDVVLSNGKKAQLPVYKSPEAEIDCKARLTPLYNEQKFTLYIKTIDEELMAGIETIRPVVISALQPMLNFTDPPVENTEEDVQQNDTGNNVPNAEEGPNGQPHLRVEAPADEQYVADERPVLHLPDNG